MRTKLYDVTDCEDNLVLESVTNAKYVPKFRMGAKWWKKIIYQSRCVV